MSETRRKDVLRRMLRLADQKNNDIVRLAFLTEEEAREIAGMDLGALTELKRHANGAVEVKLVDKLAVLRQLYDMLRDSGEEEIRTFLEAMEQRE